MPGVLLTVSSGTGVEKRPFALTVRKLPIPTGPGPNRLAAEGLATDSRPGTECCYAAGQGLGARLGRAVLGVLHRAGAHGVRRARAERGHSRPVVTRLGEVVVRRIGYRSGIKGVLSLFPRDAVLNLPPCGYSWGLQRLAEMFCRAGSYEQAHEFVLAAAGVGDRQAAAGADHHGGSRGRGAVLPGPGPGPGAPAGAGEEEGSLPPLAISADGKGVAMLPRGAPPPHQGPGAAGADLREAGRDRGEERLQADGRDRGRLRRRRPGRPGPHPGAGHAPGGRQRREEAAAGGEPLVHLRHHRRPRRHHRQGLRRGRPPRPRPPAGPGSRWSTGTSTSSA